MPDEEKRREARQELVEDLRKVAKKLREMAR
jgi:hypothetical protein